MSFAPRLLTLLPALCLWSHGVPQQGGGFGGMTGNSDSIASAARLNLEISRLLPPETRTAVLTPGEYVEFTADMKQGDLMIAEAVSEVFDPALEILGPDGKVLLSNDDRFDGDQSPLLFYRATSEGKYAVRVRSFANKGGGKLAFRYRVASSLDLRMGDQVVDARTPFFRLPLKAGQLVVVRDLWWRNAGMRVTSPIGIPMVGKRLEGDIPSAFIFAPIDGDYYLEFFGGGERRNLQVTDVTPLGPSPSGTASKEGQPAAWEIPLKKGSLTAIETLGHPEFGVMLATKPAQFPAEKAREVFGPQPAPKAPVWDLSGRPADRRWDVAYAREDVTLWATWMDPARVQLSYSQVGKPWPATQRVQGETKLGRFDLYAFPAKAGEVVKVQIDSPTAIVDLDVMLDPWIQLVRTRRNWVESRAAASFVVPRDGQLFATVGTGSFESMAGYSLVREVVPPRQLKASTPVSEVLAADAIHVWRVSLTRGKPIVLRYTNENSQPGRFLWADGTQVGLGFSGGYALINPDADREMLIVLDRGEGKPYRLGITPLE